ncbi:TolC family outer membrane protein [Phenylobacterium sp.]|jgi:outer membrane protein|uniref:TolC family outer membrane protein n=1 Tax=Phenylobacterium sp. TaxID=1871053 RepID=UPI002F3F32DD
MSKTHRGPRLVAILLAGAAATAAAPASAETLADAISLAYQTNPNLLAQRATQRALDENYVQARTGYRPTINFQGSASYVQTRTPRAAGGGLIDTNGDGIPDTPAGSGLVESNSAFIGLDFNQPIWTGGRVAAALSAAEGDILSGREQLRQVEARVMLATIQAYLDVRRDQEALRIRKLDLEALRAQLDETRARREAGELTRTDVAQSEARYAQSQAALSNATAQLAISRANYALAVGQNPGDLAPEPSLAFLMPKTVDEAFSVAEQNNPVLKGQVYAEQASRARVAQARAERMPQASLRLDYGFTGVVTPFDQGKYTRDIVGQAVVTMPIFSGGLTSSRIRQQVERNNTDKITIETQRRSVLQQVTQAWNQLIASRANIDSTQQSVEAAQVAADGTELELKLGLRTTIDVLNAEQELRADQLSATTAKHDEYVASATMLSAMGRLEAKNLIPAVTQYDPARNLRKLRFSLGYVPWEEPIAVVDKAVAYPPIPQSRTVPGEGAVGPGLQPQPAVAPPVEAPKK